MRSQWVALIIHSVYTSIPTFANEEEDDDDDNNNNNNNNNNNLFVCLAWGYLPFAPGKSTYNINWKDRSNHSHDVTDKPRQTVFLEILTLEYEATTLSRSFGNQSPNHGGRGIPQSYRSTNLNLARLYVSVDTAKHVRTEFCHYILHGTCVIQHCSHSLWSIAIFHV